MPCQQIGIRHDKISDPLCLSLYLLEFVVTFLENTFTDKLLSPSSIILVTWSMIFCTSFEDSRSAFIMIPGILSLMGSIFSFNKLRFLSESSDFSASLANFF